MNCNEQDDITFEEAQKIMEGLMIEGVRNDEVLQSRDILVIERRLQELRRDLERIHGCVIDDETFQRVTENLLQNASDAVNKRLRKQNYTNKGGNNGSENENENENEEEELNNEGIMTDGSETTPGEEIFDHLRNRDAYNKISTSTSTSTPGEITPGEINNSTTLLENNDPTDATLEDIQKYSRLRKVQNKQARVRELINKQNRCKSKSPRSYSFQSDFNSNRSPLPPPNNRSKKGYNNNNNNNNNITPGQISQQRITDNSGAVLLMGFASPNNCSIQKTGSVPPLSNSNNIHKLHHDDDDDNNDEIIPCGETLMGDWSVISERSSIHFTRSQETQNYNYKRWIPISQEPILRSKSDPSNLASGVAPLPVPISPPTYFIILTKKSKVNNLEHQQHQEDEEHDEKDEENEEEEEEIESGDEKRDEDITPDGIVLMGFAQKDRE